ncbi:MAG TPA: proton-conducting transporter membrane subunit [Syntrophales bacterium]|nr:proton-conducting transporter membrane subunit [Syntrophales bacterium]
MADSMMAIAILLPVVAGFLILAVRNYFARGAVVILTALILIANSIYFTLKGPFTYTPGGFNWGLLITILDYGILIFYLYIGISLRNWLVLIFALTQIIPLAYFEFVMKAHIEVTPAFVIDNLSIVMTLVISIIGSLICIYAIRYMYDHEHHLHLEKSKQSRFLFWLVLFLGAMNGLVFANNLVWLYFFWEVTTLCCYQLISHDRTELAIKNAARALWMNATGGTAFILAIIYLYATQGGANALSMQTIIGGGLQGTLVLLPVALMCYTGCTKAAQMPFQSWLLGAMVAPTPVSALLHSSTMVKAGVYLVVRLAPAFAGTYLSIAIAMVGAFTFFGTSALAISQTTGKRVLAYSTIANLGLIIACAGINTPLSIAAAIMLIIFHAISKGLLFLCAGTIEHQIWSREIEDMEGLAVKAPLTTLITAVGILSMFLPPFGMLLGKWIALEAAYIVPLAAVFFVLASTLTIVFWTKWLGRLLQVLPKLGWPIERLSPSYAVPLWTLLIGIFVIGIGIGPIYQNFLLAATNNVISGNQIISLGLNNLVLTTPSFLQREILGVFPVWPLYLILIVALLLPFLMIGLKPTELRPVYMCGEQAGGGAPDTDEWFAEADTVTKCQLGGYYYQNIFGEKRVCPWANAIAILLLVIMIGGVIVL